MNRNISAGPRKNRVFTREKKNGIFNLIFFPARRPLMLLRRRGPVREKIERTPPRSGIGPQDRGEMIMERTITKVLVANRGVPAVRVMHTCRDRNIPTTAVYSSPDRLAHHVFMADSAVHIGEAPPVESYLNMDRMIDAALRSGSDAIHPGWGFLA